jgi:RimJ/RimL family protein N-acetyltransferase
MEEKFSHAGIKLERFREYDVDGIYSAIKDSYHEISPWLNWLTPAYNREAANSFIKIQKENWDEGIEYTFTIKNHQNELLGVIGIHLYDRQNDVASIGYWMNTRFTGKGYCTEALNLLISKTFKQLNLIRVEVIVAITNLPSQKVAIKTGATFEAILKNRIRINGQAIDAHMYAFTKNNS